VWQVYSESHQVAQPLRGGERPLAHWQALKNMTAEVCRRLHHAPPITQEAHATTFAEIGHQVVVPAVIAPGPGKAVRKDAAFQILAKGLADVGLGGVVVTLAVELARAGELQPSLEVLGYGLVQPGRGSGLLAVTRVVGQ
jgi:hypothetical protein